MAKINWGIIGLGKIAKKFAEGFSNLDNASVKAIASKKKKNLDSFKKKFQIGDEFCFENYTDLIFCKNIDIIYIALPNSFHKQYIVEAIKRRKNILVEKPAVTNSKDLKVIKELIFKNNIYFTEGFMYRHLPYFDYLKKIIISNSFGKLLKIESSFCAKIYKQKNLFGFKINKPDYLNRLFNKDLGGGSILDLGCYPISLVSFLNSITYNVDIKDVKIIKVDKEICESGVDICSNIKLNFGDKFRSNLKCSFKDKPDQSTVIYFENGKINITDTWTPKENMFIDLTQGKEKKKINFKINRNIYSNQIRNISEQLINNRTEPIFPSIGVKEIENNTKLLERWIESKQVLL